MTKLGLLRQKRARQSTSAPRHLRYGVQSWQLESGRWVNVIESAAELCQDEALLLCPGDRPDEWVTWMPDCGEVALKRHQFAL